MADKSKCFHLLLAQMLAGIILITIIPTTERGGVQRTSVSAPHLQDPHEPPTVLELFALPGAGKSTVADALAASGDLTTRKGLTAQWRKRSAPQRLTHIGRGYMNIRVLAAAARFGFGTRLRTKNSFFRLMRLVAKTQWLRSRSGVVLLDQGFLQDVWSILLSSKVSRADPELLSTLIRSLYEGTETIIVVLEVDPQTASSRISGRSNGTSRFDNLPESELHSSIAAVSELQRQIAEAARLAGLTVHTIDASPPPQVVVGQLTSLLLPVN